ncbi:uncharacterized protein LOC131575696 isoform X3 [Poecile atricapillus]|uniref:uncharacterized protein LOC131575696 isoform X3 n=1 Tax=Poecile atricapillus TaxID=48891 RepID=UPI0027392FC6|nr:uncharacterized protein LOC131575696 isoform X3 [Poecile atricapillus]
MCPHRDTPGSPGQLFQALPPAQLQLLPSALWPLLLGSWLWAGCGPFSWPSWRDLCGWMGSPLSLSLLQTGQAQLPQSLLTRDAPEPSTSLWPLLEPLLQCPCSGDQLESREVLLAVTIPNIQHLFLCCCQGAAQAPDGPSYTPQCATAASPAQNFLSAGISPWKGGSGLGRGCPERFGVSRKGLECPGRFGVPRKVWSAQERFGVPRKGLESPGKVWSAQERFGVPRKGLECPGKVWSAQEGLECPGKVWSAQEGLECPGRFGVPRKGLECPGRFGEPRKGLESPGKVWSVQEMFGEPRKGLEYPGKAWSTQERFGVPRKGLECPGRFGVPRKVWSAQEGLESPGKVWRAQERFGVPRKVWSAQEGLESPGKVWSAQEGLECPSLEVSTLSDLGWGQGGDLDIGLHVLRGLFQPQGFRDSSLNRSSKASSAIRNSG